MPATPRSAVFYLLPKIHKRFSLPGSPPPGRPIVSGVGSLTERISAYVDHHLQPLVTAQPSYIKDTYDFLTILRELEIPTDTRYPVLLVTIDVVSLYTNIPHTDGLAALRFYLDQRPDPTPSTDFLFNLARFVLEKNYFTFGEDRFLQIQGTAMGTKMAPSYANLFMSHLEEDFLLRRWRRDQRPLVWRRFIDDVFMIWSHGELALTQFMNLLNSLYPVTFTYTASPDRATFLDVDIVLDGTTFRTSVHSKETNAQLYLHYSSCHPPHTKKSIPRSLSIRGHRISSDFQALEEYLRQLRLVLQERGYPRRVIADRVIPAHVDYQPPNNNRERTGPFLVTSFFFGAQKLNAILRECHALLLSSPLTRDVFPDTFCLSYRRGRSLENILSHKVLRLPNPAERLPVGLRPCPDATGRCMLCALGTEDPEAFSSANVSTTYRAKGSADCNTPNCIYQLLCQVDGCNGFYVGMTTTPLRLRINNHRSVVDRRQGRQPAVIHARDHDLDFNDCYRVKVLRVLPPDATETEVRIAERAHIEVLGGLVPPGFNLYR